MIKLIYIFVTMMLITINTQHSLTVAVDINDNFVMELVESSDTLHEVEVIEEKQDLNKDETKEDIKEEIKEDIKEEIVEVIPEKKDIDPNKPMIAITFDDGPSAKYTPIILDILKENNINATFFVLGCQVQKNKEVMVRIAQEGHELGNHTYNHKKLTLVTDEELNEQISETDNLIEELTGKKTTLLRPPFGYTSEKMNERISKPIILWSMDTRDWESRNAEIIRDKIIKEVKDGDIVLLHDIHESTAEAVKEVIPQLINMGFQLVTVSELYEYKEKELLIGEVYSKPCQ